MLQLSDDVLHDWMVVRVNREFESAARAKRSSGMRRFINRRRRQGGDITPVSVGPLNENAVMRFHCVIDAAETLRDCIAFYNAAAKRSFLQGSGNLIARMAN